MKLANPFLVDVGGGQPSEFVIAKNEAEAAEVIRDVFAERFNPDSFPWTVNVHVMTFPESGTGYIPANSGYRAFRLYPDRVESAE